MDQAPGADALIDEVVGYLRSSRSVLVITGAGLSADSGLPTYRGRGGLYDAFPAGEGLNSDPARIWRHLGQVEHSCRGSRPNRGHAVIAAMEQEFERCWVLTQNIDGLHQQAGSHNVISIHGNLHEVRCCACDYQSRVRDYAELGTSPHCPSCGASLHPDVVTVRLPERAEACLERIWQRYGGTLP